MLSFPKIKIIFPSKEISKPSSHKRIDHLHGVVSLSFARVRDDTSRIFQWLDYLHNQNLEQQKTINSLRRDLSFTPKSSEDIKRIVDSYYSFDALLHRLEKIEEKLTFAEQKKLNFAAVSQATEYKPLTNDSRLPANDLRSQLQRKIIKKITRNSKNYIKNTILSMVSKYDKISALELREIVVEEQNLCSKSSFYRLLEELEEEQALTVVAEGKEKIYFSQPQRTSARPESKE